MAGYLGFAWKKTYSDIPIDLLSVETSAQVLHLGVALNTGMMSSRILLSVSMT